MWGLMKRLSDCREVIHSKWYQGWMSPGVTLHKVAQRLLLAAFGPINVRTQVKDRLVKRDEAVTIHTKRKSLLKSTLSGAGAGGHFP